MFTSAIVTAADLGDLLGISERRITDLERSGIVFRAEGTRFKVRESVRSYCEHQRKRGASSALTEERQRLIAQQADAQTLKNEAMRRELLPAADVEAVWTAALLALRQELLGIPGRLAPGPITAGAVDVALRAALEALGEPDEAHGL